MDENTEKTTIEKVVDEIRSFKDSLNAEKEAFNEEKRKYEQERAAHDASNPANNADAPKVTDWRSVAEAMIQKRAITLSGTGNIETVMGLVKVAQSKNPLLAAARYFYGPNASTNIPVWSPTIATPSNYAEGVTDVSSDSTAVLGKTTLTPYAYISVLPVSNDTLKFSSVALESELPSIFGEVFSKAMHNGMITGNGTSRNMSGLFTQVPSGNQIACAAAGLPAMSDIVGLALQLQDFYDDGFIVMNPAVYSGLTLSANDYYSAYKEELIRNKTIEGIKVIITSTAPKTVAANDIVAVGGRMSDYAIAVASELEIVPLKKVGDNNTYFQACMYFNGAPIIASNFYALKAIAG